MEKTAIDRNRNDSFGCLVKAAMPFKNGYILSVLLAIVGVFFKVMPFILISQMRRPCLPEFQRMFPTERVLKH